MERKQVLNSITRKGSALFEILCLISALAVFLIVVKQSNASDSGANRNRINGFDKLLEKAVGEGYAKIIVELSVPAIGNLTTKSRSFKSIAPGHRFSAQGIQADAALAEAINMVTGSILNSINGTEYRVNHTYSTIPYLALHVSAKALSKLSSLSGVLNITEDEPVGLNEYDEFPKGPLENPFTDTGPVPPTLNNTISLIGADDVWASGYTGSGWYVAILDTGIRSTHEMFSGKTIVEACFSNGGDCPNSSTEMYGNGASAHYYDYSSAGGYDHGTHVAGIAAGDSGTIFGVARDANIIAVQVFSRFSGTYYCGSSPICVMSYSSDQLKGLEYVYSIRGAYSIAAVNMSLGGGAYSSYCDSNSRKAAIDNLRAAGIATVISSGNSGYCGYIGAPACISSAVSVGASTDDDEETYFNNWDETLLDFFAPGYQINSSTGGSDSSYGSWSGTSMAAPHVTGAWALLKQYKTSGTVTELFDAFNSTGRPVVTTCPETYDPDNKPRIQVDSALQSFAPTAGTPSTITVPSSDSDGSYTVSWGSSSTGSVTYILEEATNESFSSDLSTAYSGPSTSTTIPDRSSGTTYYYRVKATRSGYTDSSWCTGSNGCVVSDVTPAVTIFVSSDGKCGVKSPCYDSIQDAIDNPATNIIILVKEGTYAESLSLGSAKTVLIKGGYDLAYDLRSSNTTFIEAYDRTNIEASSGSLRFQMISIKIKPR